MEKQESSIIIYTTENGSTNLQVKMENETVWLTQSQMAELFQTDRTSIVRHINNIYKIKELNRESTCAKIAQVQMEGNRKVARQIHYFNLDMIISIGYRVNSKRGVQFRQWTNRVLKEYLMKGTQFSEVNYTITGITKRTLVVSLLKSWKSRNDEGQGRGALSFLFYILMVSFYKKQ